MNDLMIFNNPEFGEIRTVELAGEPWLVGKDVAEALGYSNPRDALDRHVDDEDKATVGIHDGSQSRNMTIINESGLYSLVLSSKLPGAKKFRRWVTAEVLPSIRRHGLYAVDQLIENPDLAIQAFSALKEEREFQSTHPARGATANFTKEQRVCLAQFAYLHKGKKAEHTKTNAPMLH